jgi:MFS family permease
MNAGARNALTLAALLPVLGTIYQTLVLTDLVDEDIRRGIQSDKLDGTWLSASWGLSMLYGVFAGILAAKKIGPRNALVLGLFVFSLGNLACGYSSSFEEMMVARFVEGFGKGMAIVLMRSFLYSRFDGMVFLAVLCYGTLAYSTRGTSPLVAALVNDYLGWRWVYWASVPLGIAGIGLILLFVPPDPHNTPGGKSDSKPDGLLINLLVFWLISLLFVLGWRQREGAFTSNLFTGLFALNIVIFLRKYIIFLKIILMVFPKLQRKKKKKKILKAVVI